MHIARLFTMLAAIAFANTALAQVGTNAAVVNPNLAEKGELTALPGVTATIADRIIEARPISSNVEIGTAIGDALSDQQKSDLRALLFLPINLNSVSDEELMLVPGIDGRMAHEFEEYRPYSSIEQFRREIGKYVDDDEVARYEQYVFVPMDLNSASSGAFATIPGMSSRMVHEFEEYRPYESMQQFRREIGKYVDEDEVARLERYVFIK